MQFDVVTKVLDVNSDEIVAKMNKLGAQKVREGRVVVEYFRPKSAKTGEEQEYLLLRTYEDGLGEVAWNGPAQVAGILRRRKDIDFVVSDTEKVAELLAVIGYSRYARQEKDRRTWVYDGWQFHLDQYPEMPPYLKIKGNSDEQVQEAINLLGLQDSKLTSDLDRVIIQFTYHRDWYDLRFSPAPEGSPNQYIARSYG